MAIPTKETLPAFVPGKSITAEDLNKLRREVQRIGRITGGAGVSVQSNATGIQISATGGKGGGVSFVYAQLLGQCDPNGTATAQIFTIDNGGNWVVTSGTDNQITVMANPLLMSGQYYASGSRVGCLYATNYGMWIIWDQQCMSCV